MKHLIIMSAVVSVAAAVGAHFGCSATGREFEYRCNGTLDRCTSKLLLCNGYSDCPEGDDELEDVCQAECASRSYVRCGDSGVCIRRDDLCDGFGHCSWGEQAWDERPDVCKQECLGPDYVQCAGSGKCMRRTGLCDGVADCVLYLSTAPCQWHSPELCPDEQPDMCKNECVGAEFRLNKRSNRCHRVRNRG